MAVRYVEPGQVLAIDLKFKEECVGVEGKDSAVCDHLRRGRTPQPAIYSNNK